MSTASEIEKVARLSLELSIRESVKTGEVKSGCLQLYLMGNCIVNGALLR